MKADPEVKMISAEAPILFAKGCDIFITELTMRAWIHAEENKRRTLQRSDIASALAKSDMFDFLIDIVPREEASSSRRAPAQSTVPPMTGQTPTMGQAVPPQQTGAPQMGLGQEGYATGLHEPQGGYNDRLYGIPEGQPAYQPDMYGTINPYGGHQIYGQPVSSYMQDAGRTF